MTPAQKQAIKDITHVPVFISHIEINELLRYQTDDEFYEHPDYFLFVSSKKERQIIVGIGKIAPEVIYAPLAIKLKTHWYDLVI